MNHDTLEKLLDCYLADRDDATRLVAADAAEDCGLTAVAEILRSATRGEAVLTTGPHWLGPVTATYVRISGDLRDGLAQMERERFAIYPLVNLPESELYWPEDDSYHGRVRDLSSFRERFSAFARETLSERTAVPLGGLIAAEHVALMIGADDVAAEIRAAIPAAVIGTVRREIAASNRRTAERDRAMRLVSAACDLAGPEAFTLRSVRDRKGYDARTAENILSDDVLCVIVSHKAPTKAGFRFVEKSPIVYYRKSTGGKWGRSVQQRYVLPR